MASPANATQILYEISRGDPSAAERLMPLVYDELRAVAARDIARENPGHTLQATAIVHEAYLRLVDQSQTDWKDRAHFCAVAAEMIRRVLIDHHRQRRAAKRGGYAQRIPLTGLADSAQAADVDLVDLDEALGELRQLNERQTRIVELRFFGGLSIEETAHVLDISPQTVKADWHMAKAWLAQRLDR